jgi:hypothetical protein
MPTKRQLIEAGLEKIVRTVLSEATFKGAKVTYSDGTVITSSINPNISDDEIRKYYRVGSKVNIGRGEHDKMVKIVSVEVLPPEDFER